jgi:UDP-3-O-[3-hydroxymyristoyl] glucosamine N-acyltransferase
LADAGSDQVSFLANRKYAPLLGRTRALAVILGPEDARDQAGRNLLVAADPYFAFREAVLALHGTVSHPPPGIRAGALIDPTARLGRDCCVQPLAFIGAGATVGDRCVIYPHCYIGDAVTIGSQCVLYPSVTIYPGCVLGDRVTLHAGCVIGVDGFGYATHQGSHHKITPAGNVVIEHDVELGACCAVERATVGSTRIGAGTKFSDLVAIGHGVSVGRHNLLVAQVGLAGSVRTGSHVVLGGQAGVAGHLQIGDRAQVAAKSGVMGDVPADTQVGGLPAVALTQAKRQVLLHRKIPALIQELRKLQARLAAVESAVDSEAGPAQGAGGVAPLPPGAEG